MNNTSLCVTDICQQVCEAKGFHAHSNQTPFTFQLSLILYAERILGSVTGYQVIRVIRIFAKTYPFE